MIAQFEHRLNNRSQCKVILWKQEDILQGRVGSPSLVWTGEDGRGDDALDEFRRLVDFNAKYLVIMHGAHVPGKYRFSIFSTKTLAKLGSFDVPARSPPVEFCVIRDRIITLDTYHSKCVRLWDVESGACVGHLDNIFARSDGSLRFQSIA